MKALQAQVFTGICYIDKSDQMSLLMLLNKSITTIINIKRLISTTAL